MIIVISIMNLKIIRGEIGSGIMIINSMSKIKNTIEIIKNWFENLNVNFDIDSNPHSTFDLDSFFIMKFCSNELHKITRTIVITILMKKCIGKFI